MKVIIFGASGYVGLPVANALVRNGHVVVGVTRTASKNKLLLANEIIPAVGDIFDPATWSAHLVDADAVISLASGNPEDRRTIFKAIESTAATVRLPGTPKLVFIATSGTWVYGDDRSAIRTESSPLEISKMPLVARWRPAIDKEMVESTILDCIIVRCCMCYGRAGSLWAMLFSQAEKGEISWMGTPGGSYATIHVDDLAELFLLVVEKSHLVRGLVVNAANDRTESVDGILKAFAAHIGIPLDKISYRAPNPKNPVEEALTITTKLRPTLARTLLGWAPRKASMMDGIATYYASYKAVASSN
ncbi:hypothetical protein M408DRAFT_228418 [Serendipita vermifera MAFF 305830]|uniref:NAD-dependent epimerase/dehydratase domain-containing protein n=1 Tax=Serendipita vermifera MAFF 305830 TaxID=933852 RepID=A0A0C3AY48_SERVB|nr:hypothetical protein M408DRAFT_228418 [Serendipita vermifera MAFF 305830]